MLEHGMSQEIPGEMIRDYLKYRNLMEFESLLSLDILVRLHLLSRVGSMVYSNFSSLEIPADSELEVPERYFKEKKK